MAGAVTGVLDLSYQASEALTKQTFVKLSGDQTVAQNVASNTRSLGVVSTPVSTAEATAGKSVAVQTLGVAWVVAGGTVTRGDRVMSDTAGKAVTAATAGNIPVGYALKGAASGALCLVLLTPNLPAI